MVYPDDAPRDTSIGWSEWSGNVAKIEPDVLAVCCERLRTYIEPLDDAFGSIDKGTLIMVSAIRKINIQNIWGSQLANKPDPVIEESIGKYTTEYRDFECVSYMVNDKLKPELVAMPVAVWRRHRSDDKDHKNEIEDTEEVDSESSSDENNDSDLRFFAWVLQKDDSDKIIYRRIGSMEGSRLEMLEWLLGGVRKRLVVL